MTTWLSKLGRFYFISCLWQRVDALSILFDSVIIFLRYLFLIVLILVLWGTLKSLICWNWREKNLNSSRCCMWVIRRASSWASGNWEQHSVSMSEIQSDPRRRGRCEEYVILLGFYPMESSCDVCKMINKQTKTAKHIGLLQVCLKDYHLDKNEEGWPSYLQ